MPLRSTLLRSFALAVCLASAGCGGRAVSPSRADESPRLPIIVAHRAGAADYPENTLTAIEGALQHRADAIWLTVQLTRDGVPVLYRPANLSTNTDGQGAVASLDFAALERLNAGWNFARTDASGAKRYPYRDEPVRIPSLAQALRAIPPAVAVMLDMKALPAEPQAAAVARVLDEENAWQRVLIYSTEAAYQKAFAAYPRARLFESRDATRARLAAVALSQTCENPPPPGTWSAFEYARKMELVETFTLGEARSHVTATLWTPAAVKCFRTNGPVHMLAIGISDDADYRAAACLGLDAVLADSPRTMHAIRTNMQTPPQCPASVR
ncbi:hydrolase [Caballeronia cordobensis]|uniref:Hydrolase n=1 Tax=Caballeronia cordobensis TaxID=1353886 RepID=A0A158JP97_CABCO|nr:glycerophosphodiester phosphodiesterase family protein [Caballeronia cordobensis]SAL70676.1 hydrolase [Caballeronia cordobensis]